MCSKHPWEIHWDFRASVVFIKLFFLVWCNQPALTKLSRGDITVTSETSKLSADVIELIPSFLTTFISFRLSADITGWGRFFSFCLL